MTTNIGPFNVGDVIAEKYVVRGLLGKGGHAFVYDCFHTVLEEEVAIKVIHQLSNRGAKVFSHKEAKSLRRMNHPNVVSVRDAGDFNGMPYIVMEKLSGMDLRKRMQLLGPLTVFEAVTIASQVGKALAAAHAIKVIHRDLKPENIFLVAGDRVKVLDFGIAKVLEAGDPTTQKDLIQGTIAYMSPEQMQGHGVTFASDVFQLGVLIFELIAGICPCLIGVEEPTNEALIAIQISKMPPRLKSLVPEVPEYLDRLVWRALAKEPSQRYPAADAERDKLRSVHSGVMTEFSVAIDNVIERLKVDLPPEQLVIRTPSAGARRDRLRELSGGRAPVPNPDPRTTPIALASSSDAGARTIGPMGTEVIVKPGARKAPRPEAMKRRDSRSTARRVESPASTQETIRRMFSRAAVIGAALAFPAGLALWFTRVHSHSPATDASAVSANSPAVPEAAAPPENQRSTPSAPQTVPAPAATAEVLQASAPRTSPEPSPQPPQPTPLAPSTPALTASKPVAKSPRAAVSRSLPVSGLDWLDSDPEPKSAVRPAGKPAQPKPGASSNAPKVKLIF